MPSEKRREYQREYGRAWRLRNAERVAAVKRAWTEKNKEKIAAIKKAYYSKPENIDRRRKYERERRAKNPEKFRELARKWRLERPLYWRDSWCKRKGITKPTRPAPDLCECCGGPPISRQKLCLDHCHEKKTFRGWLCNNCNAGLGFFSDSQEKLAAAISYLKRWEAEAQKLRGNQRTPSEGTEQRAVQDVVTR